MIAIRALPGSELERIGEVDRSEHITGLFRYRDGVLARRAADERVPPWHPTGADEHSVAARVTQWRPILERGGTLLGAFDGEALAGFAIYRPRLAEGIANLAALFVGQPYRRRGVASRLAGEVVRLARGDGARRLYVSATPSDSAVGFYRRFGFEPTDEPNAELFALEPEDIHLILELNDVAQPPSRPRGA